MKKILAVFLTICITMSFLFLTTVLGSEQETGYSTTTLLDAETNVSIYGASRQNTKYIKQGEYSFYSTCTPGTYNDAHKWGIRANAAMFETDLTAYEEKGALIFWVYTDGDISGIPSDIHLWLHNGKYDFNNARDVYYFKSQITESNAWNRVVIPFSQFSAVNGGISLASVTSISIYSDTGMTIDMYYDDFIAVSDVDMWQMTNEMVKTQKLWDVETEISGYGASRQNKEYVKQGEYSLYSTCAPGTYGDQHKWGFRAGAKMFELDLTAYAEKGALVFWVYADGSVSGIPSDIQLWLQANTGGYSWDARNVGSFKSQITKSHAWNRVVIPFSDFTAVSGGISLASVTSFSIYSGTGVSIDMYYDDFIAVSDYTKYLEACSDNGYMMLDDAEEGIHKEIYGAQVSVNNTKNGEYSYYTESTDGDGNWIYRSGNASLGANISAYIDRGAFAFHMYIDGEPTNMGNIICWLTSDSSYHAYYNSGKCNGYKWEIANSDLKQGWNEIILPFSEANTADNTTDVTDDITNPTNINQFSVISTGKHNVNIWTDCYMVIEDSANGLPILNGNDNSAIVAELPFNYDITSDADGKISKNSKFADVDASTHGLDNLQLVLEADISGTISTMSGQLEITSSGKEDTNELHFLIQDMSLKTGKNVIRLNFEDGVTSGGEINLSAINYARIYTYGGLESGAQFKITSLRIEDTSHIRKNLGITAYGMVNSENTSFSVNGDFLPTEIQNAVLMAEVYITGEAMPTEASVTISQSDNVATANLSDYEWKQGKNIIYIPAAEFSGSDTLTYINSASVEFVAENASTDTEIYVSTMQIMDGTMLGGYGAQGNLAMGNIEPATAAVELTLNVTDAEKLNKGAQITLTDGSEKICHNINGQLQTFEIGRNIVVLPLGDFVGDSDIDFNALNGVTVSEGANVEDIRIINSCNNVQKAESYMPTLFSDNMMFQQNKPITVWGYSAPLSETTATLYQGDSEIETKTVQADVQGKYEISFTAREGSFNTYKMVVTDAFGNVYTIDNILIGEVWLAGGQSNMEFTVAQDMDSSTLLSDDYLASDINKGIRVYLEPTTPNAAKNEYQPKGGVTDIPGAVWGLGTDKTSVSGMSSLAYTYARELVTKLNVPVGILNTAVGGTCIETWISRDYAYDKITEFDAQFYKPEHVVVTNIYSSGALYHQKIEALEGFGIAGTIWYQGESNSTRSYDYDVLLNLLKSSYSDAFGFENNTMPFIFTQVAPDLYNPDYNAQHTAYLSEAMENAYRQNMENNMAMLAIYDLPLDHIKDGSSSGTIHPRVKTPVGERFALSAMNLCYGGKGEHSAPIYDEIEIVDGAIYINFLNVGDGLKAVSGETIYGFTIAGADNVYSPAKAEIIDSDTVKVYSHLVTDPKNVTYAFETMNQSANLANSDGIVASPFRTYKYADNVNTVDSNVTYYNTQDWMGANGDSWQNISYAKASISQLWSVDGNAPEYSTERYSEGSASLNLNIAENATVTAVPKMNVYGGKAIDLANYSTLSVDVSGTSMFDITLIVTNNGVDYTVTDKISVSAAEGFGNVVFDLTALVSADGTEVTDATAVLSDASISFKVSANSASTVYVDNIMIGTAGTTDVLYEGDVNRDKTFDIRDLVRICKVINNSNINYSFNNADVGNDKKIDVTDVKDIKTLLLIE